MLEQDTQLIHIIWTDLTEDGSTIGTDSMMLNSSWRNGCAYVQFTVDEQVLVTFKSGEVANSDNFLMMIMICTFHGGVPCLMQHLTILHL